MLRLKIIHTILHSCLFLAKCFISKYHSSWRCNRLSQFIVLGGELSNRLLRISILLADIGPSKLVDTRLPCSFHHQTTTFISLSDYCFHHSHLFHCQTAAFILSPNYHIQFITRLCTVIILSPDNHVHIVTILQCSFHHQTTSKSWNWWYFLWVQSPSVVLITDGTFYSYKVPSVINSIKSRNLENHP